MVIHTYDSNEPARTVFDELNDKLQKAGIRSFRITPGSTPTAEGMARQLINVLDELMGKDETDVFGMVDQISEPLKNEAVTCLLTDDEIKELDDVFSCTLFDYDNQLEPRNEKIWSCRILKTGNIVRYWYNQEDFICIVKEKIPLPSGNTIKYPEWKWKSDQTIEDLTKDDGRINYVKCNEAKL